MLGINMDDVLAVIKSCKPYIIFLGVVLALAVVSLIVSFAVKKFTKKTKFYLRVEAGICAVIALIISVNLILVKPLSTLLDLVSGKGSISEESIAHSKEFGVEVAQEGITLLKNKDGVLPLKATNKVNVFGWASTNPCYGGSGSGGISDAYEKDSILQGLEMSGFEYNKELSDFYTSYRDTRPTVDMFTQDWTLPEPPVANYSKALMDNAKEYSDTAIIVFARTGCENADLPTDLTKVVYNDNSTEYQDFGTDRHYLQLSRSEENLVNMVCENFSNVIIVYNGSSVFELGFIDQHKEIKGALWCPGAGQTGFEALGQILSGDVNPSAKTTDILVYDLRTTPSFNNFMITNYDNMDEHSVVSINFATGEMVPKLPSFVNYVEGIYVGYKFYETAGDEGLINYNKEVQFPFGYGLSYTTFSQTMGKMNAQDGKITFDVTVKNTGKYSGKEVVEVYYNPPYINGGAEKSTSNIITYGKTKLLEPGESQTLTMSFDIQEMASYDTYNEGCYVLDEGTYKISIRKDSHNIISEQEYKVPSKIVYNESNPRKGDKIAATNHFQNAEGNVEYLSRKDKFANYKKAVAAPSSRSLNEELKALYLDNTNYNPENYNDPNDVMPVTGAKNGVKLEDLRGKEYDDPLWEKLLDELTVDEMDNLIALGGYQTGAIPSIGKVSTTDCDGPVDIYNNFTGVSSIGMPAVVALASTWNDEIAEGFGSIIAKMATDMNVSGWYAPSMNMHRGAFAGRNFEYYSEDGRFAGLIAQNVVKGAMKWGVYPYIKHFALNDQETERWYKNSMWANEQAIREVYLKPFELSVKNGGATAVMSSYNYIGPEWAGACSSLQQKVLRDEWGFRGMVITDYFLSIGGAMNADQAIRNGSDLMLTNIEAGTNHLVDKKSATGVKALRNSTHNILYTVVNSRAYDGTSKPNGTPWRTYLVLVDVLLALIIGAWQYFTIRKATKKL